MLKIVSLTLFAGFFAVVVTDYVFETTLYEDAQPVFGALIMLNLWLVRNVARYLRGVRDGSINLQQDANETEETYAARLAQFYD